MEAVRIVAVFCLMALVAADTPANCSYEDVEGKWVFSIGEGGFDRTLNCSSFGRLLTSYSYNRTSSPESFMSINVFPRHVQSSSHNDVPRVAQWYGTMACASVLIMFVVCLHAHVQFCWFD